MELVGIVGKPNVGKSTFFKAATLAEVEIANYPFATIKPNIGVGHVRTTCASKHFNVVANPRVGFCLGYERFIPIELIDVAGLVPGAHEGKGLGNAFLEDLRPADALIHVIDASGGTNDKGEPVDEGSYHPRNDVKFLETELDMWYFSILQRCWDKLGKSIQAEKLQIITAIAKQLSGLKVTEVHVEEGLKELNLIDKAPRDWSEEEVLSFAQSMRKKTKPIIIAANKCDREPSKNHIKDLQAEFPEYTIIPCAADAELALREAMKHELINYVPGNENFTMNEDKINEKQKTALSFIQTNVLDVFKNTGVQQAMNEAVFGLLQYICIYPGGMNNLKDKDGNVLPDCFLMKKGSTALDFAFKIHTDIGKNFVKAMNVKKRIPIGKDHVLEDGDVVEIMTKS